MPAISRDAGWPACVLSQRDVARAQGAGSVAADRIAPAVAAVAALGIAAAIVAADAGRIAAGAVAAIAPTVTPAVTSTQHSVTAKHVFSPLVRRTTRDVLNIPRGHPRARRIRVSSAAHGPQEPRADHADDINDPPVVYQTLPARISFHPTRGFPLRRCWGAVDGRGQITVAGEQQNGVVVGLERLGRRGKIL